MKKVYLGGLCLGLLIGGSLWAQAPPAMGQAPPQAYGRLQFTPPAGWQAFEKADLLILVPAGATVDNTTVSITLFPPTPRHQQSLARWMKATLQPIRSSYRILKTEEPTARQLSTGAPSLLMTELLGDPAGAGLLYQLYCAIAVGASGQLIMYSASNPRDFARGAYTLNSLVESVAVLKTEVPRKNRPRTIYKKPAPPLLPKISA